jgi:hypothetical protein
MPSAAPPSAADYAAFLARQLPLQRWPIDHYLLDGEQVWLKRAGPGNGLWRYRLLGAAAALLRLPVLRPVPNRGGQTAIATEVRRLRALAAQGLRVPVVLAAQPGGFLMSHLGVPGQRTTASLAKALRAAVAQGADAVLPLWRQGLDLLDDVHSRGLCLSQAFARNMVLCPDGALACVDFEDDPAAALPLPVCQARDALCYLHSTAVYLAEVRTLAAARAIWHDWLAQPVRGEAFRAVLRQSVRRLRWLCHLPQGPRWGRDAQRLRAAYDLLETM